MSLKPALLIYLFVVASALVGCQKSGPVPLDDIQVSTFNESLIYVTGPQGEPIAGAKVLIGDGNSGRQLLVANEQGKVLAPSDWTTPETVTIFADGFVRASFGGQTPHGQQLSLRKTDKIPTLEIKGVVNGFAPFMTEKDGNVDFALILPTLKLDEFYFFNESKVISPESDYISIFGQKMSVPANVSLPSQKEKYGIISFTLEKPVYRTKVSEPGQYGYVAIRARTSLKSLKDRIPPLELLNEIQVGSSSERTALVSGSTTSVDFEIGEKQFNSKMAVTAPEFQSDLFMLSVPLVNSSGNLYPSDVKSLKSRQSRQLSIPASGVSHLLNVLTAGNENGNRGASASLTPITVAPKPFQFLGILEKPMITGYTLETPLPTLPDNLIRGGMYITLSQVKVTEVDGSQIEQVLRLWEVFLESWTERITLPNVPKLEANDALLRWEVSFMAGSINHMGLQSRDVLANFVQNITHVTRNSTDVQQN